ncbi:hypothetical protein QBC39DRAFT_309595 [Podospora conica]|nr:hypothetical protein QBC39DRAFT_309595 [Schizothecium conicum]
MELARVDTLVNNLASLFESGLDFYTKWKKKLERQPRKDAVSTSLDMSSHRIKATYQVGFAMIGPDFSAGDDECRRALSANLSQLQDRVNSLRQALGSQQRHFINLHDMFLSFEGIRIRCITALADQYRRFASGRPVPQEMPIPGRLRAAYPPDDDGHISPPPPPPPPTHVENPRTEFDRQTAVWSTNSDPPVFQSEPPSPPLTPKVTPDDMESCFGGAASVISAYNPRQSMRPKNSVFSIFCPEAMSLQVDPSREFPVKGKCSCGYKWNTPELDSKGYLPARDGFRVTKRFLAKSHCDRRAEKGVGGAAAAEQLKAGYGCVLCISTGHTETFETAETLRTHINTTHHKWQMLHDSDMT